MCFGLSGHRFSVSAPEDGFFDAKSKPRFPLFSPSTASASLRLADFLFLDMLILLVRHPAKRRHSLLDLCAVCQTKKKLTPAKWLEVVRKARDRIDPLYNTLPNAQPSDDEGLASTCCIQCFLVQLTCTICNATFDDMGYLTKHFKARSHCRTIIHEARNALLLLPILALVSNPWL